jgi:hypothetical protein
MSSLDRVSSVLQGARSIGYASENPVIQRQSSGSQKSIYHVGDAYYEDEWYGGDPYSGQETVSLGGKVVWVACYRGKVKEKQYVEAAYTMLRTALHMPADLPYRGPAEHKEASITYRNQCTGDLAEFYGTELVQKHGKIIYNGRYFGGLVDV